MLCRSCDMTTVFIRIYDTIRYDTIRHENPFPSFYSHFALPLPHFSFISPFPPFLLCPTSRRFPFPNLHRVSKNCAKLFYQKFANFPPISIIFGRKMANRLKLCKMHSFSTSSNSRHHTTVLNADVPNCYTKLKVVTCNKLFNDLINTQSTRM